MGSNISLKSHVFVLRNSLVEQSMTCGTLFQLTSTYIIMVLFHIFMVRDVPRSLRKATFDLICKRIWIELITRSTICSFLEDLKGMIKVWTLTFVDWRSCRKCNQNWSKGHKHIIEISCMIQAFSFDRNLKFARCHRMRKTCFSDYPGWQITILCLHIRVFISKSHYVRDTPFNSSLLQKLLKFLVNPNILFQSWWWAQWKNIGPICRLTDNSLELSLPCLDTFHTLNDIISVCVWP